MGMIYSNRCPVCSNSSHSKYPHREYIDSEQGIIVEHFCHCENCGYVSMYAYSSSTEYEAYLDITRGFKHPSLKYVEKDSKRHRRVRKKALKTGKYLQLEVNPRWVFYTPI